MEQRPFVTFITVVYNGAAELETTIQSILHQSSDSFEYFIIDGGSTDGTVDLIRRYEDRITGWVSEKDTGLYEAMNKGMKLGTGKYLWFMNAGDEIRNSDTLEKLNAQPGLEGNSPEVVYGETEIMDAAGKHVGSRRLKAPRKLTWTSLQWGMVVCHQSFLVRRDHCLSYDLQYRLASDIDWMIRILKNASKIYNADMVLSAFKSGGVSQKNIRNGLLERFRIMVHYYGFPRTAFNHFLITFRFLIYFLRYRRI